MKTADTDYLKKALQSLMDLRIAAVRKKDDALEKDLYEIEMLIFKYQDREGKDEDRAEGWIAKRELSKMTDAELTEYHSLHELRPNFGHQSAWWDREVWELEYANKRLNWLRKNGFEI